MKEQAGNDEENNAQLKSHFVVFFFFFLPFHLCDRLISYNIITRGR